MDARPGEPIAEGLVAARLHGKGRFAPAVVTASERLAEDILHSITVRGGGCVAEQKARIVFNPQVCSRHPKLAHGNIAPRDAFEQVSLELVRSGRLGAEFQSAGLGQSFVPGIVILRIQIADREPVIPLETRALLRITDHTPGQNRQPRPNVVASQASKIFRETCRPRRQPAFVAVAFDEFESRSLFGRHLLEQLRSGRFPLLVQCLCAQVVDRFGICAGVSKTKNHPISIWRVPAQAAGIIHLIAQIQDLFRLDIPARRQRQHGNVPVELRRTIFFERHLRS